MDESRIKAAKRGNRFYQGRECAHGHGTTRYVMSGCCLICAKEKSRQSYMRTKDRLLGAKEEGGNYDV